MQIPLISLLHQVTLYSKIYLTPIGREVIKNIPLNERHAVVLYVRQVSLKT